MAATRDEPRIIESANHGLSIRMTNLTGFTLPQLKQLKDRISKEIAKREIGTKTSLLKRLRKLAMSEGLRLEELLGAPQSERSSSSKRGAVIQAATASASAKKSTLPPKYANPNNLSQSWSGRGRKPGWVDAWLANGGTLDALENAAQTAAKGRRRSPASPAVTMPTVQVAPEAAAVAVD